MKKTLISAALGLSVIASSLAISGSANAFQLVNYSSYYSTTKKCLALRAGTGTDSTPFIVYHCDGTASQQFSTSLYPGFTVTYPTVGLSQGLWNEAANQKGVSVGNNLKGNNSAVILWSEGIMGGSPGQSWKPDATNSPVGQCYRFINPNSGRVLSAQGGSMADGTAIVIYDDFKNPAQHPDQYWCVQ